MNQVAELLFGYLRDVIYEPENANLDVEQLPEDFQELGRGFVYFAQCVMEAEEFAGALAKGDLAGKLPSPGNEIAAPLKSLHASLKHLTWQTQQVAQGDYQQRVGFMGEFSEAFNSMAQQLEVRNTISMQERSKLENYIALILLNTQNIIIVFDTDCRAVLASETYKRCTGFDDVQILGRTFKELFAGISTDDFLESICVMIREAATEGKSDKTKQSFDFKQDGSIRSYVIDINPMLHDDDEIMGTMVVLNDMTEIIEAQQESERARVLAEQSTKAKSEFLARMTHEMRTPMNAIIGMTSIGMTAGDAEKKDYSFRKIKDASTHLLGVINDILDISKIEADKLELAFSEFLFIDMLDSIRNIITTLTSEKDQTFSLNINSNIPESIITDKQRLIQVITNLLSNASKFSPKNGRIELNAIMTSQYGNACSIKFSVKDNGIGISKEQQEHLFIPFEQADGSISRKFGGTGLGLAISKRIIEMLGGEIWVQSELNKGAEFMFEITAQIGAGSTGDDEADTEAKSGDAFQNGEFAGKRIMIAEDVDINREIIEAFLEDTGVEIDFAYNGIDAVTKFLANPGDYGLILMDIQMPEMDGYEAVRQIRSSDVKEAQTIPVIAMTANVLREDVEHCLEAGMNGHLGKPINIEILTATLRQYLQ